MDRLKLLNILKTPEFDYNQLTDILRDYSAPRDQISKLIKDGSVIRVKKGIYALGEEFGRPYSPFVLANMIYGPSYISGHSALSYFGALPERVELIESTTPKRKKDFKTPLGRYLYDYLPLEKYQVSIERKGVDEKRHFLIASPEKALVQLVVKENEISSYQDVLEWIESMRIEESFLKKLRIKEFKALEKVFNPEICAWLIDLTRDHQRLK